MLLSPRKNGLASLFKEVRVSKDAGVYQNFEGDLGAIGPYDFQKNPYGPIPWCLAFRENPSRPMALKVHQTFPLRLVLVENNPDHPHPPYLKKICPQNMPYNGGSYGIKVGENQGISTENMAYGPNFYGIRTVFIGGGGGL